MLPLLLALAGTAAAQGQAPAEDSELMAWEALYDSRLRAALNVESTAVQADYDRILSLLRDDSSPLAPEVHYWLALSLLRSGDVEGAADALGRIGPREQLSERDRALLTVVEIKRHQVTELPYRQDFDRATAPSPWVRSWQRAESGDLDLVDMPDGNRVVAWPTLVQKGHDDTIFIPFRDGGPTVIRLAVRAERLTAYLRCMMEDDEGQQWSARVLTVPTDTWTGIQLSLADFALVGDPRSGRRPDPRRVRSFLLVDVTGFRSEEVDLNRILVDDLEFLP